MVDDHGKANDELARIAQGKGVTPPAEPDAAHQRLAARLQAAKGGEFDRLYVSEAGVKDHKAAAALFTDQAKNGKDAELKAFAEKTLPTIKEHEKMAQELARSAGKQR
jgi:putative membrane protein